MVLLATVLVFCVIYGLLMAYYFSYWKKLEVYTPKQHFPLTRVSVIIPARNEEKNIWQLLVRLSQQTYPKEYVQLIVVDDYSTDGTAEKVRQFPFSNLLLIHPEEPSGSSSKKKAIESGIRKATGELIVTTDADCLPDRNWIYSIASYYACQQPEFIAGPVMLEDSGSWFSKFQVLDFLTLQGITGASVTASFHSLCNGANLAYKRSAFEAVQGFNNIDQLASGDDMLLMYKIQKKFPGKVHYLKCRQAIVSTHPMNSWKEFIRQRKRWASKTLYYEDKKVLLSLLFVYVFNLLFFILLFAGFYTAVYWWLALAFWVIKTLTELPLVYAAAEFFQKRKLVAFFFFFQPVHMFYVIAIGIISQWGKYEWKGRKVR